MESSRLVSLACLLLLAAIATAEDGAPLPPDQADFFERRVRPVLVSKCLECHGPKKQEGGLRLDSREALLRGGDGGQVVVAGRAGESRLATAIGYGDELKMPPGDKLDAGQIAALTRWIELGLPWPKTGPLVHDPAVAARDHWSLQPVREAQPPEVADAAWTRTPIDHFVLFASVAHRTEDRPRDGLAL